MESIKARFFGRKTIIADLVPGLLAPSQPLDFSLVGPKLIGKSRLLKHLADETGPLHGPDPYGWRPERFRGGHNIIVGHYDCDWPAAKAHLTEFISQRLAAQLQEEGHRHFDLDWERINSATSPGQRIGQMVRQLDQRQIRLVLLLDNFDHVLRSKHVTPDMVNELRPLTNELGLVVATEEALHDLPERTGISTMQVLVTALAVHHQTGGDLVRVLERLAQTLRDRIAFLGRLRTATIASRATAILMLLVPPAVVTFFVLRDPNYLDNLMDSRWGRMTTMAAIVLQVIGTIWILRILRNSKQN